MVIFYNFMFKMPCKIMWVKVKDNFPDLQSYRELQWLFLGEIQAKNNFSCFSEVCSSEFICLDFIVVVVALS